MKLAPIALFAFNRPDHLRLTLDALAKSRLARESDLHIFCDGPRGAEDCEAVNRVLAIVRSTIGFRRVNVRVSSANQGLALSVIRGVEEVLEICGRAIILEDDLLVAPTFLEYMNLALNAYANEERVMQVSGYMFPVRNIGPDQAMFLPFTTSWGWATWKRAWGNFDQEARGAELLRRDSRLRYAFDLQGAMPYFSMLEKQERGEVDSWAIRWYLSVFLRRGLVLYPPESLIQNIGFDGSGTHCGIGRNTPSLISASSVPRLPENLEPSQYLPQIIRHLRKAQSTRLIGRIWKWVEHKFL